MSVSGARRDFECSADLANRPDRPIAFEQLQNGDRTTETAHARSRCVAQSSFLHLPFITKDANYQMLIISIGGQMAKAIRCRSKRRINCCKTASRSIGRSVAIRHRQSRSIRRRPCALIRSKVEIISGLCVMRDDRLPVMLLTGFLGSGKTTLLNSWLAMTELANAAVIVNEFGEIGIDHTLIASSNANTI